MEQITNETRKQHWTAILNECSSSGMTKAAWCNANGVSEKRLYYWQRILRKEAHNESKTSLQPERFSKVQPNAVKRTVSFTEVKIAPSKKKETPLFEAGVVIRKGTLEIEISNTAAERLLTMIGGILRAE